MSRSRSRRRSLALLLPGHNEELIIATTIKGALAAGQKLADIYVVDDGSSDNTRREALTLLPESQVLSVGHSGKAQAVLAAIKDFEIESRYHWLHVADADSVFGPNYFRIYRRSLDPRKYAVAVGFVQSMRGNWIAHYRCFSYTYGQHIFRRIQSWLGMISVFPGPVTCFRTDIIKKLDFSSESLTEDFDLTLQVHRKRLGRIRFIPEAVNYTQDPRTLSDFCNQTARWQRGFFQGVRKYKIGTKPQRIDVSLGYQMFEVGFYVTQMLIIIPFVAWQTHNFRFLPLMFLGDYIIITILAGLSVVAAKRPTILLALPYFYFLRLLEISIFVKAFFEVMVLRKYQTKIIGWEVKGRRYKLDDNALQDISQ